MAARELESALASMKSTVWRHFGFPIEMENDQKRVRKDIVVCRLCKTDIKYTCSTTNMSTHLKRHHADISEKDYAIIVGLSTES